MVTVESCCLWLCFCFVRADRTKKVTIIDVAREPARTRSGGTEAKCCHIRHILRLLSCAKSEIDNDIDDSMMMISMIDFDHDRR